MNIDLSLIPLKDLADEVIRRSDCGIIHVKTLEGRQVYFNWVGPYYEALGYCVEMQHLIKEAQDKGELE